MRWGGMVARQTAPGCTRCVRTEKGSARTKQARAEAPRTGVYVISAWIVRRTGRTGCNRAQGSCFADEHIALVKKVLAQLEEYDLPVSTTISVFHVKEVEFLGYWW